MAGPTVKVFATTMEAAASRIGDGRNPPRCPHCRLAAIVLTGCCMVGGAATGGVASSARYNCETSSCAAHDTWVPIEDNTSLSDCIQVQQEALNGFAKDGPQLCRLGSQQEDWEWPECRSSYCGMYELLAEGITENGGPGFRGGNECRPLLDFNRTLCETKYRDAEAFCSCLCPTMHMLDVVANSECETQIFAFLLLGRRGANLSLRYPLSTYCRERFCDYLHLIGDPDPFVTIPGHVPSSCYELDLPYRKDHCVQLLSTVDASTGASFPYDPTPWDTPVDVDSNDTLLQCSDGTTHVVDVDSASTLDVCWDHGDRWRCPEEAPIMCSTRECVSDTDYCCEAVVNECASGKSRECSPILCQELPEWHGYLTPADAGDDAALPVSTSAGVGDSDQEAGNHDMEIIIWITVCVVVLGVVAAVASCVLFGNHHFKTVSKTIVGQSRLMALYKADPVSKFQPTSFDRPLSVYEKLFGPKQLPPLKTPQEIEAEQAELAAVAALKAAVETAEQRSLYASHQRQILQDEMILQQAVGVVKAQGLQSRVDAADLLLRGEKWLRQVKAERELGEAATAAKRELEIIGARALPRDSESGWQSVEELKTALKAAEGAGVTVVQVKAMRSLLSELVAKLPQVPADRCVLDPSGEGIRMLPVGQRRAIDPSTGDLYVYDMATLEAGIPGDPLPPRIELGSVSVDEGRPVCAEFAKQGSCRAGRRCPWRHAVPKVGDTIKECILPF